MTEEETRRRLAADLEAAGLRAGGTALVHSSLSALGYVPGGADTVIESLLTALGDGGTLLMPALSYQHVGPHQPLFDVRTTPSNVGVVSERFRRRQGVVRSLHPTHSVCGYGPAAPALLGCHAQDHTPCGPHSPFRRLREAGGHIVFLGCGLRPNTSMHGVEELVEPQYLFGATARFQLTRADGGVTELDCRCHDFRGYVQRYDRIAELLAEDELRVGEALAGTVHVLQAEAVWARGHAALREDPLHFVEPSS